MLRSAGFQGGFGSSSLKECIELLNATVCNSPAPLDSGIGRENADSPQFNSPDEVVGVGFCCQLPPHKQHIFSLVTSDFFTKPQIFHANIRHNHICVRPCIRFFSGGDVGAVSQHHQPLFGNEFEKMPCTWFLHHCCVHCLDIRFLFVVQKLQFESHNYCGTRMMHPLLHHMRRAQRLARKNNCPQRQEDPSMSPLPVDCG